MLDGKTYGISIRHILLYLYGWLMNRHLRQALPSILDLPGAVQFPHA